jgi:hypothetical protein
MLLPIIKGVGNNTNPKSKSRGNQGIGNQGIGVVDICFYLLYCIREATNKGWILGNERFKKQIEIQTGSWSF